MKFDPRQLKLHSIGNEPALALERLDPEWIRNRFSADRDWVPEAHTETRFFQVKEFKSSAVLLPLLVRDGELRLLLTQRTDHLNAHAGQISFPGGRVDAEDVSVIATALRETEEEVGIPSELIEVIGELPAYFTGTGYKITPIVAILSPDFTVNANPSEVAKTFEVPMQFLMNGAHHQRREYQMPDQQGRPLFYAMEYRDYFIWGATAGIIRNLYHLLRA